MIVRPAVSDVLLIRQPDHAALAADLMAHWHPEIWASNPQREALMVATREHDNGWREVDAHPYIDETGGIRNFLHMPPGTHTEVWPRGIERLAAVPYAAALVAQHALHIFREHRGKTEYCAFFDDIECRRDRHLAAAGIPLDRLAIDYFFVRTGDLLSLTFCNAWQHRQHETGFVTWTEGEHLVISPDPFHGREIPFTVPARRVPARPFDSRDEADAAFHGAPIELLAGVAAGHRSR